MGYDNVIRQMGEFGPYQRRILLILSLGAVSWAFQKLGGVFTGAKPDFRCLLPDESPENATYQSLPNGTNPGNGERINWPQCENFLDYADLYNASEKIFSSTLSTVKCDSFVYDKSQYTLTTTTEWDLVCDKTWLKTVGDSLFMFGDVPGVVIFGGLSDKYGRKRALLLALTIQFFFGVLVALSPEFIAFTIFKVFVGTTISGVYLIAYISAIEVVGPSYRMAAGTIINLFYAGGYILIAALAYFIKNWRILQIVFTIPSLACLLFWRYIPESARWLLAKGRTQEAKDIFHGASLENGVELSQDTLDGLLANSTTGQSVHEKTSMVDMLRYPNLRRKSAILFLIWFSNSLTYYGLSWNTSNLGGDDYLNFVIAGTVEIPAHLFVLFTINRWGRKIILCSGMFLSGTSLLVTFFVSTDKSWLIVLLAMIGKSAITVAYATAHVFSAEQYPTAIRNVGVGACSAVARIGGVVAPYINHLFEISTYLPLVILGSSSIVCGLLSLLLPETLNEKMPESVEEGEQFGKCTGEGKQDIVAIV